MNNLESEYIQKFHDYLQIQDHDYSKSLIEIYWNRGVLNKISFSHNDILFMDITEVDGNIMNCFRVKVDMYYSKYSGGFSIEKPVSLDHLIVCAFEDFTEQLLEFENIIVYCN